MSEFLSTNWLGLIGAFTGISAIIISVYTYRKENPNLKVSVTDCQHKFTFSTVQSNAVPVSQEFIEFFVKFHVSNVGDRGTRINDIGLSFKVDEKEYHVKKSGYWNGVGESKWIDADDNADIEANFYVEYKSDAEKDPDYDCVFTIYHTHNPCKVKAVSIRVDRLKDELGGSQATQ